MIYIFLILGILVLNLFRLNEAIRKPNFSIIYFLKQNGIPALIILIFGFVIINNADSASEFIARVLPEIGFKVSGFTMFMFGITGDVLVKKLIGIFDPKKETKLGFKNKK